MLAVFFLLLCRLLPWPARVPLRFDQDVGLPLRNNDGYFGILVNGCLPFSRWLLYASILCRSLGIEDSVAMFWSNTNLLRPLLISVF